MDAFHFTIRLVSAWWCHKLGLLQTVRRCHSHPGRKHIHLWRMRGTVYGVLEHIYTLVLWLYRWQDRYDRSVMICFVRDPVYT